LRKDKGWVEPSADALRSVQAIVAGGEEIEEAEVAEDLELPADFVPDLTVSMATGLLYTTYK
jgi:hypothetical protein